MSDSEQQLVELMAWADEAIADFAKVQRDEPVSTPAILGIILRSSQDMGDQELYLTVLLATAIQKLSQYV